MVKSAYKVSTQAGPAVATGSEVSTETLDCAINGRQRELCIPLGTLFSDVQGLHESLPSVVWTGSREDFGTMYECFQRNRQSRHFRCELKIHSAPLRNVHFASSECLQHVERLEEFGLTLPTKLDRRVDRPSRVTVGVERKSHAQRHEARFHCCDVSLKCHAKQSIDLSTRETPLDRGSKNSRKNGGDRSQSRPCFPVNSARFTKPPALTDAVQHAHSLIPLWTAGHSATPTRRGEITHG